MLLVNSETTQWQSRKRTGGALIQLASQWRLSSGEAARFQREAALCFGTARLPLLRSARLVLLCSFARQSHFGAAGRAKIGGAMTESVPPSATLMTPAQLHTPTS